MIYTLFVGVDSLAKGDVISGVTDLDSTRGRVLLAEPSFFRFFSDAVEDVLAFRVTPRYWSSTSSVGVVLRDPGVPRFMLPLLMVPLPLLVRLCSSNTAAWRGWCG